MEQEMRNTGVQYSQSDNSSFVSYNVLKMRLDTEPTLKRIELYLKGCREVYELDGAGNYQVKIIEETSPKANSLGINSIMSWVGGLVNNQIVQGYIKDFDALDNKLAEIREDMLQDFMTNLYNWNIKEAHFEGILDLIMTQLSGFLSRMVGNKERESYAQTMQHVERNDYVKEGRKKLPWM